MPKHGKHFKLFGFINILDILWVVMLVALVFGAVQFSIPREVSARTGDVTLRYTIELGERQGDDGQRRLSLEGFHENVQIGETLFDGLAGQEIGRIVDVYTLPFHVDAFEAASGTFRRAGVEGLEYVYIVVEANAQVNEYETLIGHFSVGVGRVAFVRSKYFAGEGFITAVEFLNE